MSTRSNPSISVPGIAWIRMLMFYGLWMVLAGTGKAECLVGLPTAVLCGWLSARLLPPHGLRWKPLHAFRLALRFLRDSLIAGVEIAWIALRPKLRLKPGYVAHPSRLPEGGLRDFFNIYNSLMPGTLAIEPDSEDRLQFHCLDTDQPIAAALQDHEAALLCSIKTEEDGHA